MDPRDAALREHLVKLLDGGQAHLTFDEATSGLPADLEGATPPNGTHSPWRLIEHMRIAQWDILRFCLDPDHVSPEFPGGYWPEGGAPPDDLAWERSLARFRSDLESLKALVTDPTTDLFARIPHGQGQTVLREALLVADHNAYHLGQLVEVRRALGAWSG